MFAAAVCSVILREVKNLKIYLSQAREALAALALRFNRD